MCPAKRQPDQRSAREGFRLEECLAAEYMAAMLSPRSIPALLSPIDKVQVQGRSVGGDDVILHHRDGRGTFIQSKLTIDGLSPSSAFGNGIDQLLDQYLLHLQTDPETDHRYWLAYAYDNTGDRLNRFRQWLRHSRPASRFEDLEEYAGRGSVHQRSEDALKRDEEFLTLYEELEAAALERAGRSGEALKDAERMGFLRRVGLLPVIFNVESDEFTANTIRYLGDVLDDPEARIQAAKNLIHLANSATGAALDIEKVRDAANIPAPAERPRYAETLGVPIPVGDFLDRDFGVATRRDESASQGIIGRALDLLRASPADVALTGHVGLSGMGGVGKTALATEICHRLAAVEDWAGDHPGGVLWIAAGFEHAGDRSDAAKSFTTDERHILLRLGRLLGVEPDANAEDPDNAALAGALRDGLRSRDGGLLVLDNHEDPLILASFRSFLPSGWQLLVTSRRKDLEGFEERNRIPLDCYTRDEAIEYLSQPGVLGQLTDSGREAAQRLHEVSGGLPLVCSVVAESVKWGVDTLETAVDRVASESASLMAGEVPAHLAQVLGRTGGIGPAKCGDRLRLHEAGSGGRPEGALWRDGGRFLRPWSPSTRSPAGR